MNRHGRRGWGPGLWLPGLLLAGGFLTKLGTGSANLPGSPVAPTPTGVASPPPARELSRVRPVTCEGRYPQHLQGICLDEGAIYWSFTTRLVKSDLTGRVVREMPVVNHHGDLCLHEGRLYVAVNLGAFNDPQGNADSWVYVYDTQDLRELARHALPAVRYGAGGVGVREGRFFVVGGLPEGIAQNFVYEYSAEFQLVQRHAVASGPTHLGIQTATFAHDRWWFGCYGNPAVLLVTDAEFRLQGRHEFDCSLGVVGLPGGRLLAAHGTCAEDRGCTGAVRIVVPDQQRGLRVEE